MKETIDKILAKPAIAHLVRAAVRFGERNGPLYAAAVTYFSVLSLVPILMFTFAMVGMTLTLLRPDWLGSAKTAILTQLAEGGLADKLGQMIDTVFAGWGSVGLVALAIALWTGTGWIGNLRKAVQFQLRDDPSDLGPVRNPLVSLAIDLGVFLLFIVVTLLTLSVTTFATTFNTQLLGWLGLQDTPGVSFVVGLVALLLTAFAGTVLFMFLFLVLPGKVLPKREYLLASVFAGVGLMALQSLAGIITSMFSNNMSASVFGSTIVIMLFFNLYATLIMFAAAWIGTADVPDDPNAPIRPIMPTRATEPEPVAAVRGPVPARSTRTVVAGEFDPDAYPAPDPAILVSQDVAARGIRVGARVGYGLGAVTGAGFGVLIASIAKGLTKKKQ